MNVYGIVPVGFGRNVFLSRKLSEKLVFEHTMDRVIQIPEISRSYLLVSEREKDHGLLRYITNKHSQLGLFVGSDDLNLRTHEFIKSHPADYYFRIAADQPFLDVAANGRLIRKVLAGNYECGTPATQSGLYGDIVCRPRLLEIMTGLASNRRYYLEFTSRVPSAGLHSFQNQDDRHESDFSYFIRTAQELLRAQSLMDEDGQDGASSRFRESGRLDVKSPDLGEPVILGGAGRSGTTLLLAILGSFESIFAIPHETGVFCEEPVNALRLQDELCPMQSHHKRWCEKTPKNSRVYGRIVEFFDGRVKLINIIRDGRDVVTSVHPGTTGYWTSIDRWVGDVEAGLSLPESSVMMHLKYEDLVLAPEAALRKICAHIGEPFSPALLQYEKRTNIEWISDAEDGRPAVEPIFARSVGKWRKEEHREIMEQFSRHEAAMNLSRRLGYL